jgi:hypothetical protein
MLASHYQAKCKVPTDVLELLKKFWPEHVEWLSSIGLGDIPSEYRERPACFLAWLASILLSDGSPLSYTGLDDRNLLIYVQDLCALHSDYSNPREMWKIAPRLSPILALTDPAKHAQQGEGLRYMNEMLTRLRFYVTPNQKFQHQMSRTLENSKQKCDQLLAKIRAVSKENQFYKAKIDAIQALLSTKSIVIEAVTIIQGIIAEMEQGRTAEEGRAGAAPRTSSRVAIHQGPSLMTLPVKS